MRFRSLCSRARVAGARLSDYTHLSVPQALIAQAPAEPRESARLLVLRREAGTIEHRRVRDLPELLGRGSWTAVINNTRVDNCKLVGSWATPAAATDQADEVVYLLERDEASGGVGTATAAATAATAATGHASQTPSEMWLSSGHGLEEQPAGARFILRDGGGLCGEVIETRHDGTCDALMRFTGPAGMSAEWLRDTLLSRARVPLPPYVTSTEAERKYQTAFARVGGAVAAPTAGLHLTDALMERLRSVGVGFEEVTLHVGYGTFGRVSADKELDELQMHRERLVLDGEVARRLAEIRRDPERRLLAVGTTACRTLESCAVADGGFLVGERSTDIFIRPPYDFQAVDGLLTNLHVPGLTPLMLTSAFGGHELVLQAYEEAIEREYRFYSFGDAMLLLP